MWKLTFQSCETETKLKFDVFIIKFNASLSQFTEGFLRIWDGESSNKDAEMSFVDKMLKQPKVVTTPTTVTTNIVSGERDKSWHFLLKTVADISGLVVMGTFPVVT